MAAAFPEQSVPASAAIIADRATGGGDLGALVHGFLRAVWAEERDVADEATVRAVLAEAGFDPASRTGALERNTDEAIRRGVFGAPSYLVGAAIWGQDRLPLLEAHLAEGRTGTPG